MAKGLCKRKGADVSLERGDARDTTLPPASYDLAISYYVLMTMPTLDDVKRSANEMKRILKPGGYAIVATMGTESFEKFRQRLERAKATYIGSDRTKVQHAGPIYVSERTLLTELFPAFSVVRSEPMLDCHRGIYNHCMILKGA